MIGLEVYKKKLVILPFIAIIFLGFIFFIYSQDFNTNKLTGNAVTTVNVSPAPPSYCNFSLYQGHNLISFHCISGTYPRDFLLSNISNNYTAIFGYSETDSVDKWKSYNPSLPSWVVQDLVWINYDEGYWLTMKTDSRFDFEGIINSKTQTNLREGWNLISYPKNTISTPALAFSSISGSYSTVLQYKAENDTWYYYTPGDGLSTLTTIEPDYGYWINLTADASWVYP